MGRRMKNVSVIGIGRLGLCFCLTLERAGYDVIGHDILEDYADQVNNKDFFSYEPGVNEMLARAKKFLVTCDIKKAVNHANIIFVTVASYSEPDGRYDVS